LLLLLSIITCLAFATTHALFIPFLRPLPHQACGAGLAQASANATFKASCDDPNATAPAVDVSTCAPTTLQAAATCTADATQCGASVQSGATNGCVLATLGAVQQCQGVVKAACDEIADKNTAAVLAGGNECLSDAAQCGAFFSTGQTNPALAAKCKPSTFACAGTIEAAATVCVQQCLGVAAVCEVTCAAESCPLSQQERLYEEADKIVFGWNDRALQDIRSEAASFTNGDDWSTYSGWSTLGELADIVNETDGKLVLGGFLAMMVFSVFVLARGDRVKSRVLVGLAGVLLVVVAAIATFGITAMASVKFSHTHMQVLPFLCLGLGVNDMFVLAFSFDYDYRQSTPNMVGNMLSEAGVSITLTSLANAAAFFIASFMPLPTVSTFSISATIAVLANYVVILIGFTAVLALYANNVRKGGSALVRCGKASSSEHSAAAWVEQNETSTVGLSIVKKGAAFIMKTPVRVFILLAFAGLLTVGFLGASQIGTGFPLTDILPDTHYIYEFLKAREAFFGVYPAYAIIGRGNADDAPVPYWNLLPDMIAVEQKVSANKWTHPIVTMHAQSWVDGFVAELNTNADYKQYLGDEVYKYVASDGKRTLVDTVDVGGVATTFYFPHVDKGWSKDVFNTALMAYVNGPGILDGEQFSYGSDGELVSTYIPYLIHNLFDYDNFVLCIETTRAAIESFPYVAYPGSFVYNFYTQFLNVKEDVFVYTGGIAAAIAVMSLIFLYDPRITLIYITVILMVVAEVYGICYYIDLKINAIMSANLVLAVGMGVEFTAHIARVFMISQGTRVERARASLHKMGLPILYGGISTIIGIVFIAFAEFPYFKLYFFHMYLAIICIGLGNGLLLLPVILSFIGPPALALSKSDSTYDSVKTKYAANNKAVDDNDSYASSSDDEETDEMVRQHDLELQENEAERVLHLSRTQGELEAMQEEERLQADAELATAELRLKTLARTQDEIVALAAAQALKAKAAGGAIDI
jgi:predicted RND superfamily exporter protein